VVIQDLLLLDEGLDRIESTRRKETVDRLLHEVGQSGLDIEFVKDISARVISGLRILEDRSKIVAHVPPIQGPAT